MIVESETHYLTNTNISLKVLEIVTGSPIVQSAAFKDYLLSVKQPCRFEKVRFKGRDFVLDVGHNS
jgi:folylpolyglutamate synthase/dihydropteroate synthase